MTPEIAEQLKNSLTTLVEQDGGTIEIVQFTNNSIEFDLLLGDEGCADCVMPKQLLERIIFEKAKSICKDLKSVTLNDPR